MRDAGSTDVKLRRKRRRREEERQIETVACELKVWRDEGTNEIVIAPPLIASAAGSGGRIFLSARHARHLANSLLLFAAETELNPTFTATASHNQVAHDGYGDEST